ncbi:MSMEG_4193 family putative phosphomutase [Spelaeicoccus albus]|uniref:Putative phosphomutase (TIGR03848 family) n=1 Tax=Spelaeicoccus albus TaxID=1280376 RepID=A0A7Z0D3X9_9MICO|nr:MSMEG_4193 family putative phosphomutase [Spelaeicoccus albus]NYI68428.1 putative phosphomutase (TIGR03848 family) [Spelaeicoccus albus]
MATVLLIRHAESTANKAGELAGRTPGVDLTPDGAEQARRLGLRLRQVRPVRIVHSPLDRCVQTLRKIREAMDGAPMPDGLPDDALNEVDYGGWQGKKLADLAGQPEWKTIQNTPSAVRFPGGESIAEMSARAVAAVRGHDAEVEADAGNDAVWMVIAHGDIIKAVLADALGMPLDLFQRLVVSPCSLSAIRYTSDRPFLLALGAHADRLVRLPEADKAAEGVVGGGD